MSTATLATLDRATRIRIAVVAVLLAVVVLVLPPVLSLYWIDVLTAVAIYSVVALGLPRRHGAPAREASLL